MGPKTKVSTYDENGSYYVLTQSGSETGFKETLRFVRVRRTSVFFVDPPYVGWYPKRRLGDGRVSVSRGWTVTRRSVMRVTFPEEFVRDLTRRIFATHRPGRSTL